MSAKYRRRKIMAPPHFGGYKPYDCSKGNIDTIDLLFEEYEAIKLADYKLLNHQEAAILMDVSRATFARIYENARRKIALALVETKEITMVQGNVFTDKTWLCCNQCHNRFTTKRDSNICPRCNSNELNTIIVKED